MKKIAISFDPEHQLVATLELDINGTPKKIENADIVVMNGKTIQLPEGTYSGREHLTGEVSFNHEGHRGRFKFEGVIKSDQIKCRGPLDAYYRN